MIKNLLNKVKKINQTMLGFTLIELLAVIVILAIITLIATPIILGIINNTKEQSNKRSIEMYAKAVENAITEYQLKVNDKPTSFQQIENYIKLNGSDVKCKTSILYEDGTFYLNKCEVNNVLVEGYIYGNLKTYVDEFGVSINVPTGLTPVIYKNGNWEIVSHKSKWFDYNNQEWANAVILNEDVSKDVGTKIYPSGDKTNIKAMFVYVPRYEYKIEGEYGMHTDGTVGTQALPGEIKVNFIPKSQTNASNDYIIHPAFKFGDKQLEGIWVGKFEVSHSEQSKSGTPLGCIDENCEKADDLRILPNVKSLRNNNMSNFFYGIRSMSRKENGFGIVDDTHIIKNSEWGAIAYLSQSKYGKYGNSNYTGANKEIYQNKSKYITGMSNGTPSVDTFRNSEGGQTADISTSVQCSYDATVDNCGIGASTTGNITGIYDMSGGSFDRSMGIKLDDNLNLILGSSEFGDLISIEQKYYETYTTYGINDIGQSLSETSVSGSSNTSWYNDDSRFITRTQTWFNRGGYYKDEIVVGVFNYSLCVGGSSSQASTRVVLVED